MTSMMIDSEYSTISIRGVVEDFDKPLTLAHHGGLLRDGMGLWDLEDTPRLSPPEDDVRLGSSVLTSNENSPRMIIDETKPPSRYRQHTLLKACKRRNRQAVNIYHNCRKTTR